MDFVFSTYFGIEYQLTENPNIAVNSGNLYINYSKNKLPHFYNVFQDDLLLQDDIHEQKLFVSREAGMPVFFQTTDHYELKFDVFSGVFYLLSRYEEYLPHEKDIHDRYKSSNSILAKKEFNFSPVIETWLIFLKEELLKINPVLSFKKYQFEYIPTFDIDNVYRYLGRNWKKHPPSILEIACWKTLSGQQQDPYDVFDEILLETNKYKLKPTFFFLLNDDGKNNSNVSPESKRYLELIRKISEITDIGLHPSYHSLEENLVADEYHKLFQITNRNICNSRQHFLKITFPELIENFKETNALNTDYSLMYPDIIGFRAGISRAFPLFNLVKNESTGIIMQPSCWMDATYEYYQPQKKLQIQENFLTLFNQLKEINGILVPIFHNDLLAMDVYWGIFNFINKQVNLVG